MEEKVNYDKLREMIARCEWTFAKSMPFAPHEYIVRGKCPLTEEEFLYFIDMQRRFGVKEHWGKYYNPYLYIDDYKYWTMGDPYDVTTVINRAKVHVLGDALELYKAIKNIKMDVEEKSPHYVNVISDLQPDEPKVSKILAGFFKQRQNGNYYVLKDFVKKNLGEALASQIVKPIIEAEEGVEDQKRIDILVYEKGKYAIVFENKIWDAPEQPNQLANYIKGMRVPKYELTDEKVYIVYLPSTIEHGPSETSWNKDLQEKFAKRYYNISFKEGILEWLKSLEIESINDESLELSRRLFIDYLNRVFNLTEIGKMENKKIDEYIHEKLGLREDDKSYNIGVLSGRINEISDCVNQLDRMRKQLCCEIVREWSNKLATDFPNLKKSEDIRLVNNIRTGIVLPFNDIEEAIVVLLEFEGKRLVYGATYLPATKKIRIEMQESNLIKSFYENKDFIKGVDWLFYKETTIDEGYENLKKLIEKMM